MLNAELLVSATCRAEQRQAEEETDIIRWAIRNYMIALRKRNWHAH